MGINISFVSKTTLQLLLFGLFLAFFGRTLDQCVEEDSIQFRDFLLGAKIEKLFDSSAPLLMNFSSKPLWKEDMTVTVFGKYFTFHSPQKIALNQDYCMTFTLVKNFTYLIFVHDDFFLHNSNPLGPPVNYRTFSGY